jgi:hypothetical protein|tara:strand:- start:12 stop:323 length:312 start_codon:yes stop_codon:yes gene_type:complete
MWFDEVKKFDWRYGEASQYKSPKLSLFNIKDKHEQAAESFEKLFKNLILKIINSKLTPKKIQRDVLFFYYSNQRIQEAATALDNKTQDMKLKRALAKIKEAAK